MSIRESRISSLCWAAAVLLIIYLVGNGLIGFVEHAKQTIAAP